MSDLNTGISSGVVQSMSKQLNTISPSEITAVILAGGQGQRMGGQDKGWVSFNGQPMICHVLNQVSSQVSCVLINANRSQKEYRSLGCEVIEDIEPGYHGPLMGMLTGLVSAKTDWILFVPCDIPLLPEDIVQKLAAAIVDQSADVAVVHDGERLQPVISLMHRSLLPSLQEWLAAGKRKIDRWYMQHRMAVVRFDGSSDDFVNLNTVQDVQALEQRL